jgi:hypothetical protein
MHAILRRGRGLVTGKKSLGSIREMPDGEIRTRISGALLETSDGVIPPHLSRAREAFVGLGADGHFCPPPSASFRALAVSLCAILACPPGASVSLFWATAGGIESLVHPNDLPTICFKTVRLYHTVPSSCESHTLLYFYSLMSVEKNAHHQQQHGEH